MEEERGLFSLEGREDAGYVIGFLYPCVGYIGIAALLQHMGLHTVRALQLHAKRVHTLRGCLICVGIPPIGQRHLCVVRGHGEGLRDGVIATARATEIGTILSCVRVRRIDDLVPLR